eukprot:COSAG02_NODE_566_length_20219_cov_13.531759_15_plen_169_part_00
MRTLTAGVVVRGQQRRPARRERRASATLLPAYRGPMHTVQRLRALAAQLSAPAVASQPAGAAVESIHESSATGRASLDLFPALSGTELPLWHGSLPAGLRLRATKGVGTNTQANRRVKDDGKLDRMQPEHGRAIWTIELVDVSRFDFGARAPHASCRQAADCPPRLSV